MLLFIVDIEASAGFASQVAAHHHALLDWARTKPRIVKKRLVERLSGGKVYVVADKIHQLERSHAEVARLFHDPVDGLHRGVAVTKNAQRCIVKRPSNAIDDKPRRVFGARRGL